MSYFDVRTYSPTDVTLTFGGYILRGWNTMSIQRNVDNYTLVRGIRGKNTRIRNPDNSAVIRFSCLQTEEANDVMSAIFGTDYYTGSARIALTLKDASGNSVFSSSEAFISGFPEAVFSDGFEYRIWTIHCLTTEPGYTVGGNTRPESKLFNKATEFIGDTLDSIF